LPSALNRLIHYEFHPDGGQADASLAGLGRPVECNIACERSGGQTRVRPGTLVVWARIVRELEGWQISLEPGSSGLGPCQVPELEMPWSFISEPPSPSAARVLFVLSSFLHVALASLRDVRRYGHMGIDPPTTPDEHGRKGNTTYFCSVVAIRNRREDATKKGRR
jgi:hypothetical protein